MRYKLIDGSLNDEFNLLKTILLNRGIEKWKEYLHLDESCTYPYSMLDNIDKAVECLVKHLDNNSKIHVIVDSDVDGFCSAAEIIRYIKKIKPDCNIGYSLHTLKQHGISDDIELSNDIDLLIIPDAGSNDVEQCKELHEKGVDVIILDHHKCDKENPYAIIVNNQICNYPNKDFCGGGIVYKFLQALDDELWENNADDFLDLVALSNISDVMDMRSFETRYYVDTGLNKIRSKVFKALIDKQSYSMNDKVNITSVQYYITPILNAMIRVGNQGDKDLLFRAFLETDEMFKYKKRGEKEEADESIYTRAARLCSNAKSRQTREVTKSFGEIENIIVDKHLDDNKILFVNVTDVLNQTLTGLVAMKVAEKHNKPCLLLRRQKLRENGGMFYGGSCRNFDYSPIKSLKDELTDTELFEFVQGHDNAAGFSIPRENVQKSIKAINKKWENINFTSIYNVDFEKNADEIGISFIKEIDDMKYIFGQGVKEPLVYISDIPVYKDSTFIMGKELNSWKTIHNDEVAYVKFSVDRDTDDIINMVGNSSEEDDLLGYMNVVGTVGLNNYKGILTAQVVVKDYEFRGV